MKSLLTLLNKHKDKFAHFGGIALAMMLMIFLLRLFGLEKELIAFLIIPVSFGLSAGYEFLVQKLTNGANPVNGYDILAGMAGAIFILLLYIAR